MDNASKALIIAGAILIAVGLMTLFLQFFTNLREYNENMDESKNREEVRSFNRYFEESMYDVDNNYNNGIQVYGYDVYNIALKAFELSQSYEGYATKVYINGKDLNTDGFDIDSVKNALSECGLSYSKLQYGNYSSVEEANNAAVVRSGVVGSFKKLYTIYKVEYSPIDGRINKILFN